MNLNKSNNEISLILLNEKSTQQLGYLLGTILIPGSIILLIGNLGTGKTVLARGLAYGLGVNKNYIINSPTFTLLNIYPGRITFFHADLYRLNINEALELKLTEEAAKGVLAVEWAERINNIWPTEATKIIILIENRKIRRILIRGNSSLINKLNKMIKK